VTVSTHKTQRRIGAGDIFSTTITNVLIQGCTILQGILLARLLGPVGRGEFAAVILWPNIFAAIGLFGVGTALARVAAKEHNLEALTRTGLVLGLGFALCASALCYFIMPLLLKGQGVYFVTMSQWFVLFIFVNHITLVFVSLDQGSGNFKQFNWTRLMVNPLFLGLVIVIWLASRSQVFLFVLALLAANLVVLVVRMVKFMRVSRLFGPVYPLGLVARDAARYGVADLFRPLYANVDKALFLYLLGVRDLGLYTVALAASGVAGILATAISSVTFGIAAQDRGSETFNRIAKLFRCSGWAWLLMGGFLALVMPLMLPLIFGKEFTPAVWPAILLIPGSIFSGQATILEQSLRAQGRAFIGLEARIIGLVVMVPVAWVASRFWGVLGIVLSYDLAQLICLVAFYIRAQMHFGKGTISALILRWSDLKTMWVPLAGVFHKHRSNLRKVFP
jgi:O-antigen/teichoic acid export membrane protein